MKRPKKPDWLATALLGLLSTGCLVGCASTAEDACESCATNTEALAAADAAHAEEGVTALVEEQPAEAFERPRVRYYEIADT